MVFKFLILTALAVSCSCAIFDTKIIRSAPPKSTPNRCPIGLYTRCTLMYVLDLQFQVLPGNATLFEIWLNDIVKNNGLAGFAKVCAANSNLHSCIGNNYKPCFDPAGWQETGETASGALLYGTIFSMMDYQCTKGYDIRYKNFDCLTSVSNSTEAQKNIVDCENQYINNPDQLSECKKISQFGKCIAKPYDVCGSKDLSKSVCKSTALNFRWTDPLCTYVVDC